MTHRDTPFNSDLTLSGTPGSGDMHLHRQAPILPPEVWMIAVDALEENARTLAWERYPAQPQQRKSLVSLVRVSKYLQSIMEPILYKDVRLDNTPPKKSTDILVDTLERHPEKLGWIKVLRLHGWDFRLDEATELMTKNPEHREFPTLTSQVLDLVLRMMNLNTIQLDRIVAPSRFCAYLFRLPKMTAIHCFSLHVMHPWPEDFTPNQVHARTVILFSAHSPNFLQAPKAEYVRYILGREVEHLTHDDSFNATLIDYVNEKSASEPFFRSLSEYHYNGYSISTFCAIAPRCPNLISVYIGMASSHAFYHIPSEALQSLQRLSAPLWLVAAILPGRSVSHVTILDLDDRRLSAVSHERHLESLHPGVTSVKTLVMRARDWEAFCLGKIAQAFPSLESIELSLHLFMVDPRADRDYPVDVLRSLAMLRRITVVETPTKSLPPYLKAELADDWCKRHCALQYASVNGEELPVMGSLYNRLVNLT